MVAALTRRAAQLKFGKPQGAARLRIVPIRGPSRKRPAYRLIEKQAAEAVRVTEVDESGSVTQLQVRNSLNARVYLMDGQELIGAKQNRILNTDVLVSKRGEIEIPVSCVEAGRWHYASRAFTMGRSASHRTRSRKSSRVHAALKMRGAHDADQHAVWDEVQEELQAARAVSPTAALSAAYDRRHDELETFRGALDLPDDTVGIAVYYGSSFIGLDLFDRHATFRYYWQSLVDSYAVSWMGMAEEIPSDSRTSISCAEAPEILLHAVSATWEQFPSPGEGDDWRLEDQDLTGSALVWQDQAVVHAQIFPLTTALSRPPS